MDSYPRAAVKRAMKVQEMILRAIGKNLTWHQEAWIIGISDRQMRHRHRLHEKHGYDGLMARRRTPSGSQVLRTSVEQVSSS